MLPTASKIVKRGWIGAGWALSHHPFPMRDPQPQIPLLRTLLVLLHGTRRWAIQLAKEALIRAIVEVQPFFFVGAFFFLFLGASSPMEALSVRHFSTVRRLRAKSRLACPQHRNWVRMHVVGGRWHPNPNPEPWCAETGMQR